MKQGFTLIELLVVVLIIGILSAVALPQYQAAVAKSRLGAVMSNVRALKNAQEAYFLANGTYLNDTFEGLAFDLDGFTRIGAGNYTDGKTGYDALSRGDTGRKDVIGYVRNGSEITNCYGMYLDYSDNPGKTFCGAKADDETANRVCKSLGGAAYVAGRCTDTLPTSCNIYELP